MRYRKKLIQIFITSIFLFSCSRSDDKIFGASDELHYISLFEQGKEFEILYNGVNTAKGTYSISGDTLHLTYDEGAGSGLKDANDKLTRWLIIKNDEKRVRSIDEGKSFCAGIYLDNRSN